MDFTRKINFFEQIVEAQLGIKQRMWIADFSQESDYPVQLVDLPFCLCHANKKSQEFYSSSICVMCIRISTVHSRNQSI